MDVSQRAEDAVIGAAMLRPDVAGWLELSPDEFSDPKARAVWSAVQAVFAETQACDVVTLEAELRRRGEFETVGGFDRLCEMAGSVPTADNVEHYATEIRRRAIARRASRFATDVLSWVRQGQEGDELLDAIQGGVTDLAGNARPQGSVTLYEACKAEVLRLGEDMERSRKPGVPTGIKVIDDRIGGIPRGIISVVAARPSVGKSAFLYGICDAAAAAGHPVHLFTLEDPTHGFAQRALARHGGVSTSKIRGRDMSRDEFGKLLAALDRIRERSRMRLRDVHGMTVEQVVRAARAERRTHKTALLALDYIQLIAPSRPEMDEKRTLAHAMRALSRFAGRDDIAVLVASQENRESDQPNRLPRLRDMAGAAEIEQSAKLIFSLRDPGEGNTLDVHCIKNHQGPKGVFEIPFDREHCRIGVP